jgi:glycerophosphoryl diester phosphodiesterase
MGANPWSASCTHGRGRYRENTLKSFREAVRCGATFIEFDVQTTADGTPIIWHDNYIVSAGY